MTKDEALKLALEALKQIDEAMPFPVAKLAQASIKEALAQPQQEPVAWDNCQGEKQCRSWCGNSRCVSHWNYTTPPQRTWVGLTDEELREFDVDPIEAKLMIAKLKERNT